jgi:prepilin-type processing-associated H-X9-DG protein
VELTKPYMSRQGSFTCPVAPKLPVGYVYADYLAGHYPAKEPYAAQVLMLWDGKPGSLSPEWRHNRGVNVGHLDGHVKWLSPDWAFRQVVESNKALVQGQLPPPPSRESVERPEAEKGVHRDKASAGGRPSP